MQWEAGRRSASRRPRAGVNRKSRRRGDPQAGAARVWRVACKAYSTSRGELDHRPLKRERGHLRWRCRNIRVPLSSGGLGFLLYGLLDCSGSLWPQFVGATEGRGLSRGRFAFHPARTWASRSARRADHGRLCASLRHWDSVAGRGAWWRGASQDSRLSPNSGLAVCALLIAVTTCLPDHRGVALSSRCAPVHLPARLWRQRR